MLEPCVGNGGGTGMLRGDGCDFGRQGGGRFSDERCIAGTGAAVSGDEARCAALEVVVALVVVVEQSS